jgi:hypothetical protein
MKFIVSYSREKDINNYLNSVWKFSYQKHGREGMENKLLKWFPEEFKEKITNAQTKEDATTIIENYLDNLSQSFKDQTPVIVIGVEKILNDHQAEIVGLLESVYGKKFPFETITVFLTSLGICPYNYEERWFMSRRSNSIEGHIDTTKHELNHFMFYYYYSDALAKKGLLKEKIEKLKEAFAILTNPEGNNKPEVKELEEYVKSLNGQPIDQIIESCLNSNLL